MSSRRTFLTKAGILAAGTLSATAFNAVESTSGLSPLGTVSLCDQWWFRTDPASIGVKQNWHGADHSVSDWRKVNVPFTWQVDPDFVDYRGVAWYRRTFDAASEWRNSAVRIEFEAVFHTATIWVNGQLAGEHVRKGYTAFMLDITHLLRWGVQHDRSPCR